MLDTNIVSDLVHNPAGRAARRLAEHGAAGICMSIITAAELRYGAVKRNLGKLTAQIEATLRVIPIVSPIHPFDVEYARLRVFLERAGQVIGPHDMLIAAHALALGTTLVTHNTAEFRRVPGLLVEDWLG